MPVRVALPRAVRQVFQGGTGPRNGQTVAIWPMVRCGPGVTTTVVSWAMARRLVLTFRYASTSLGR